MRTPSPNALTWTAVGLIAGGLLMIFLAWNGAAGPDAAVDLRAQFPYLISGGVFGLALVAAGLMLVRVFEARKDNQRLIAQVQRLTDVVEALAASLQTPADHEVPPATAQGRAVRSSAPDAPTAPVPVLRGPALAPPPPAPFETVR